MSTAAKIGLAAMGAAAVYLVLRSRAAAAASTAGMASSFAVDPNAVPYAISQPPAGAPPAAPPPQTVIGTFGPTTEARSGRGAF